MLSSKNPKARNISSQKLPEITTITKSKNNDNSTSKGLLIIWNNDNSKI